MQPWCSDQVPQEEAGLSETEAFVETTDRGLGKEEWGEECGGLGEGFGGEELEFQSWGTREKSATIVLTDLRLKSPTEICFPSRAQRLHSQQFYFCSFTVTNRTFTS